MVKVKPFAAIRPPKAIAAEVASRPYDVLNSVEAKAEAGDILAVLATGAYNYSMSSNYNRIPRPAVVAVSDGKSKVVIKRETYEDIISCDI